MLEHPNFKERFSFVKIFVNVNKKTLSNHEVHLVELLLATFL